MKYENLVDFIEHRMRMSHIYQPVMLLALLENNGQCKVEDIARNILRCDRSQVEQYPYNVFPIGAHGGSWVK